MSKKVNEIEIRDCEITYEGTKYSPVKHGVVIDLIKGYLKEAEFVIEKEEYVSGKNGQQLIGKYFLAHDDAEIKPMISFKNSLDGSMAFGVASGTSVFICGNGIVFGDAYSYKRKHTGNAQEEILENVKLACQVLPAMIEHHKAFIKNLKESIIDKVEVQKCCGILFWEDILNTTQLNEVKNQYRIPAHDYKHKGTLWEFYNHCTFALKDAHPLRWHKQHKELSDFFYDYMNSVSVFLDDSEELEYRRSFYDEEE
jgi:Domain of unknown function (DUF932)